MFDKIIRDISDFLERQFRVLSVLNYRILFYSALVYAVFAIHHFFPILYSLYTFENFTYVFFLQIALFVLYKREYFSRVFRNYLQQVSLYFEVTNFFLVIIVFVWIFLFSIQGADTSDLTGFLIILGIGSLYNSIYKNTESALFEKEKIGRAGFLFLLAVNGWMYLFLKQFLVRNGLQNYISLIWAVALLAFNGVALSVLTDVFEQLHERYRGWIVGFSRKTIKKLKFARTVLISLLTVSIFASGSYFGYGYYKNSLGEKRIVLNEAPVPNNNDDLDNILPLPQDTQSGMATESGAVNSTGSQNRSETLAGTGVTVQSGTVVSTGQIAQWNKITAPLTSTGLAVKTVPKKKVRDMYTFDRYIGIGNTGKDVIQLQTLLKKSGYYKGAITGTFDTVTGDALARFMRAKTGTRNSYTQLGPKTLSLLNGITVE